MIFGKVYLGEQYIKNPGYKPGNDTEQDTGSNADSKSIKSKSQNILPQHKDHRFVFVIITSNIPETMPKHTAINSDITTNVSVLL